MLPDGLFSFLAMRGEPEHPLSARVGPTAEHEDGAIVFAHACRIGLEGIVSKRRDSPYRSRRSPDWLKSKNPASVAAAREAEEDWYN
jgi:ATP-dependent DNA ligase